ncbi:unnamed protein product, partial [marine sediment metagenome]
MSGLRCGRSIWYFRIPPDEPDKKRYKIKLLQSDLLPVADKYVYLDADCLMLRKANWEDPKVMGARVEKPRSHNLRFVSEEAKQTFKTLILEEALPECNTGCVVVPGDKRKQIGDSWNLWVTFVDSLLSHPSGTRDQFHYR